MEVSHGLLNSQEAQAFVGVRRLGPKGVALAVVAVLDEQQQAALVTCLVHEDGRVDIIQRGLATWKQTGMEGSGG